MELRQQCFGGIRAITFVPLLHSLTTSRKVTFHAIWERLYTSVLIILPRWLVEPDQLYSKLKFCRKDRNKEVELFRFVVVGLCHICSQTTKNISNTPVYAGKKGCLNRA